MAHNTENGESTRTDAVEHLRELIKDIRVAMITTEGDDGDMRSRPMYTQATDFDGDLWFATSRSSSLVNDLRARPATLVNYAKPGDQSYVSVRGTGAVVHDQEKINALWNPAMKAWFPGGPTDPDLILVRIEASRADFWDSPAAPVRWFQFLSALATGDRPSGGEHGSVNL
jgi:general stress protein 26